MLRIFLIVITLFIPAKIVIAQRSLETCQQQARMNYPAIRQFGLIEKSKEYSLANAGKAWYPQFSVNAIGAWIIKGLPSFPGANETNDLQFFGIAQFRQTLWDGGTTHSQKEIISATTAIDSASAEVALYELKDRVNQLFFGILLIDEQLLQLALMKENLRRNLEAARNSFGNGKAYISDVDEVQVELIKSDQRETEFKSSRMAYVQMLGLMIGEKIDSIEKFARPTIPDINTSPVIRRPELQLFENQRRLTDAQLDQVKVNYMPKVDLLGAGMLIGPGISFGTETINSFLIAGLGLSWNTSGLYSGKKSQQLNRIGMDRINIQQETFMFNTNIQLSHAGQEVNRYRELLNQDDEIISLRKKIREAYEARYNNGMVSMNEVLNSVTAEREAIAARSMREIQLMMSLYQVQTISGN